ncbi:MAG: ATP-dependent DNA helicase RecG [Cytophagales bacterium]
MATIFQSNIEFLKGVGPQRAQLLQKELRIFTFGDLLQYYPFRYDDRSVIHKIRNLNEDMSFVQVKAQILRVQKLGNRLVAQVTDGTGYLDLVWFQGVHFLEKKLKVHQEYLIIGKPTLFGRSFNVTHPEIELWDDEKQLTGFLQPVYSITDKLRTHFIDSKVIYGLQKNLIEIVFNEIVENLPISLLSKYRLTSKQNALKWIHNPSSQAELREATRRLKFEELFYVQLKLLTDNVNFKRKNQGFVFHKLTKLQLFYTNYLPFQLTNAQKRVIKEIREDVNKGYQMNRLIQGDVGSGKTMVAFISMLMALDNEAQACLMAPTEILAEQHFQGLKTFCEQLGVPIDLLTGSTKASKRKQLLADLAEGNLKIIIGTHALLEDKVVFKKLGLCVIDEQHRFGVAQRAKLWNKNKDIHPHVLVMTATPIPRTLAMTVYGDLDVSVIDELPPGRKPIQTSARTDAARLQVLGFIKEQIQLGRQAYVVYPLIEESETTDMKDLMDGYESITRYFKDVAVSIVHGRMKPADKEYEMQRFIKAETKIMVATTVIEVGVNVPNATIMVIENSEKFGLAQLHQLRGRVGRGAEKSYCILMHKDKISKESKIRLQTLCDTNDGFKIADVDLQLRGPGDLAGTKQSGVLDLLIANLAQDQEIIKEARKSAQQIIEQDADFLLPENYNIRKYLTTLKSGATTWSRIS